MPEGKLADLRKRQAADDRVVGPSQSVEFCDVQAIQLTM